MIESIEGNEIISVHIGQAGVQMGEKTWDLLFQEHNIGENGKKPISTDNINECERMGTFFYELSGSQSFKPRALFIDLDPTTVDSIRNGKLGKYFPSEFLVSGKESAADNFSRGMYTVGRDLRDTVMNKFRKQSEKCDSLSGIIITHSINSGTGSGFGGLFLKTIEDEFGGRIKKVSYSLFPSPNISNSVVEPYNSLLGFEYLRNYCDLKIMFDNESLYRILEEKLGISNVSFKHCNQLIAQHLSSTTSSIRFKGSLHCSIDSLCTNLIPYPGLSFVIPSVAPLISTTSESIYDHIHSSIDGRKYLTESITDEVLKPSSFFFSLKSKKNNSTCTPNYNLEFNLHELSRKGHYTT